MDGGFERRVELDLSEREKQLLSLSALLIENGKDEREDEIYIVE